MSVREPSGTKFISLFSSMKELHVGVLLLPTPLPHMGCKSITGFPAALYLLVSLHLYILGRREAL